MAWRHSRLLKRVVQALALLSVLFVLSRSSDILDFSTRKYDTWPWESCHGLSPFDSSCATRQAALAHDVLIVVKTGGSEPQSRLTSQLNTLLSKVPKRNVLILSDLAEQIDQTYIHDVYAGLSVQERAQYPEFALYDAQQEYKKKGMDTRKLQGGWDLAKYMNLAMKRKIWSMVQEGSIDEDMRWYVFIDTDTYMEWDNLLLLLEKLDATKKMYLGSPVWLPGLQFAHGGSAYVLSHGALKALNQHDKLDPQEPLYSQYGLNVTSMCCGDEALAKVLRGKGVKLKGYWPMFNGEIPATVHFGSEMWCEPVLSLHHLHGKDMEDVWQWIEDWKIRTMGKRPFLFQDLYRYVAPDLVDILEDWENIDDSIALRAKDDLAHKSFEQCKAACESDELCLQFLHDGATCTLSHHIRLGRKHAPENNGKRRYTSGWKLDRIRAWTNQHECTDAHWLRSNP